jgi:Tfp pilus assembly PilM family ATPase/Tfp pilus assembly protein PilN
MADKILGIDIGDDAIKAVLVSRSFKGGYRAVSAGHVSISEAGGVAEALRRLFENQSLLGCPATTALPVRRLSFRNVSLPFKDEKKIRQILSFEVEPLLHFPIDEAVVDYVMVHKGVPSDLFVAIAPKAAVQERTAQISGYVKKIEEVGVDGAAIATLLAAKSPPSGCVLLLDIGAEHSAGFVIQNGVIFQIRPFAVGGNHITRTIAESLHCDAGEAERRKRENRPDGAQEAIAALFGKLLSDLDHTIEFMKMHGRLQEGPQRIYLTGGGAFYEPLQEALSRHFAAPVTGLDLLADGAVQGDPAVRNLWNPLIMNQALALAVAGHKAPRSFNFRIRDSKVRAAIGQLRDVLRWAAAVTALFLILAATDIYLDYRYSRQRIDTLKAEIMTLFKTYNPQVTRVVDPVSQMKGSIIEARKASLGIADGRPGTTALALLKDISRLSPPATELLLSSFALDKDMILLKGQAKNFDAVDTLKREFMKSTFFETVAMGAATLTKQGDKVEFEMRVTLKN